jgi:hypothetical protein
MRPVKVRFDFRPERFGIKTKDHKL